MTTFLELHSGDNVYRLVDNKVQKGFIVREGSHEAGYKERDRLNLWRVSFKGDVYFQRSIFESDTSKATFSKNVVFFTDEKDIDVYSDLETLKLDVEVKIKKMENIINELKEILK